MTGEAAAIYERKMVNLRARRHAEQLTEAHSLVRTLMGVIREYRLASSNVDDGLDDNLRERCRAFLDGSDG